PRSTRGKAPEPVTSRRSSTGASKRSGRWRLEAGRTVSPQEMSSHGPSPVVRYDGATRTFFDIFVAAGCGEIRNPTALTFGRDGNLYVDSRGNSRVLRFDGAKGTFLDTFVPQGTGGLNAPNSILFRYAP